MKILFTCGGTAGHIYPAIAIADKLREKFSDCEILFVGATGMMEESLVTRAGYELRTVSITNIRRSLTPKAFAHNFGTAKNVLKSSKQAKEIIRDFEPDAAVGTGGYVCYPVLNAAHKMGVSTLLHESNAVPGLTTRMLARKVDCLMLGFAPTWRTYNMAKKVVFTGTPVRRGFSETSKVLAKLKLGIKDDKPFVLSVWGSLGSDYMNETFAELIPYASEYGDFYLLHSAGGRGYNNMIEKLKKSGCDYEKKGIEVRDYIHNMPVCMAAADLVVCRSGASTIAELQALGKPALFIPSPNVTGDHQFKNARVLEEMGACLVLKEGTFSGLSLYPWISTFAQEEAHLDKMSRAMARSGKNNACELIASEILSFI